MFLKRKFGAGYNLRIAKGHNYNPSLMDSVIKRHTPDASLSSEIQTEVIYSLESATGNQGNCGPLLPPLFDDLETMKEKIGYASCGLSITTMEDVFLRVGSELGTDNEFGVKTCNGNENGGFNGDQMDSETFQVQ
jgi:ATP-binding cassette, subfamily A (ABC1), member 3